MVSIEQTQKYRDILIAPIRECMNYTPKFGHSTSGGYKLSEFQQLYGSDSFYKWLGLDNPLMYSAHKAAGGITSIYRQIGIGSERLVRGNLEMDHLISTYAFFKNIVGFDFVGFMNDNQEYFQSQIHVVLAQLMRAE